MSGALLSALLSAYEQPSDGDEAYFDWVLEAIGSINATDLTVARSVVDHWAIPYPLAPCTPLYVLLMNSSFDTVPSFTCAV